MTFIKMTQDNEVDDINKVVVKREVAVTQNTSYTLSQLDHMINDCDLNIAMYQDRKAELQSIRDEVAVQAAKVKLKKQKVTDEISTI